MELSLRKCDYSNGFVISPKEYIPVTDLFAIHFMAHEPGKDSGWGPLIGTLVGNQFIDEDFKKKLQRIRGKLLSRNVEYSEAVSRLNEKEYKRLSAEQKMQRKLSKLFNERNRRYEEINKSANLFKEQLIAELQQQYEGAVEKVKHMYKNQING